MSITHSLRRSQEGHELDRLKLAYMQLRGEAEKLRARNAELVRDVEKLSILGNGRATGWRGWVLRHLGL
jgi:hypothetical protein